MVLAEGRGLEPLHRASVSTMYYGWSAAASDINRDGAMDIVSGPFYYLGPTFTERRIYRAGRVYNPATEYAPDMVNFTYDFTGDGWPDILASELGSAARGRSICTSTRRANHAAGITRRAADARTELVLMRDLDGDGKPEMIFGGGGAYAGRSPIRRIRRRLDGRTSSRARRPRQRARHRRRRRQRRRPRGHRRADRLVRAAGQDRNAWTQPWTFHRGDVRDGDGEIGVYDVNGDRLTDVVTSSGRARLGTRLVRAEEGGRRHAITFVQHDIAGDYSTKNAGDVVFSEAHASRFADMNGDKIPDFIVGKRYWSHLENYNGPDPYGPAVIYIYRTVRNPKAPGGAEFVPELVHNRSGVGLGVRGGGPEQGRPARHRRGRRVRHARVPEQVGRRRRRCGEAGAAQRGLHDEREIAGPGRRVGRESLLQVVREHAWALRRLAKKPAFTVVVTVTLGLAIGGNAAIYSVISAVLLKPLPYPDPERLVRLSSQHQRIADAALSPAEFQAFRDRTHVFAGVAGFYREGHDSGGSAGPENLEGLFVTSGYFELLGARMALGRAFTIADEHPAGDQVVLSERVWRVRLGGQIPASSDESSICRGGHSSSLVWPRPGFSTSAAGDVPSRMARRRTSGFLSASTRPTSGAGGSSIPWRGWPMACRSSRSTRISRTSRANTRRDGPDTHTGWQTNAVPLMSDVVGTARPVLVAVFGGVACVLLIACGNVACLSPQPDRSPAHGNTRVRAALGASRGRIAREILIEAWVLALLGAGLGVPLAIAGVRGLVELAPPHLPRLHAIGVDGSMLVFGVLLTFLTSILCGLLPAWHGATTNMEAALREGGRGNVPGGRSVVWHRLLVVAQVALCFVLLACRGCSREPSITCSRTRSDSVPTACWPPRSTCRAVPRATGAIRSSVPHSTIAC